MLGFRDKMLKKGLFLFLLVPLAVPARQAVVITSVEWARPRSGQSLARLPALADAVRRLLDTRAGQLTVRYPGGEEGLIWGEELRDWLVALGIDSSQIDLVPGTARPDTLELELTTTHAWQP